MKKKNKKSGLGYLASAMIVLGAMVFTKPAPAFVHGFTGNFSGVFNGHPYNFNAGAAIGNGAAASYGIGAHGWGWTYAQPGWGVAGAAVYNGKPYAAVANQYGYCVNGACALW